MANTPSGIPHEDQIRELLVNLGFSNVPNYGLLREILYLGGQEIDAFGRFNDNYFVIDAKASFSERGRGDGLQTVLEKINGYRDKVIDDIKNKYEALYGFNECIFILWTKNKKLTSTHIDMARNDFGIFLRDEFDLKNYNDSLILLESKEIVRNGFFRDLINQLPQRRLFKKGISINVQAIRTKVGNKKFFTFMLEARHLLKFCYAFRMETNNILTSYQRLLNPKKIRRIGDYLRDGGYFANNILVVTDENIDLKDDDKNHSVCVGELKLPDMPCYLEIIDGQHRLFGYSKVAHLQDHCLGVTVISGLDEKERATLFTLVNKEQTKVPQYLLWDLYKIIDEDGIKGRISAFVDSLNEEAPLKELIKLPRSRSPTMYLSSANICQALHSRTALFEKFGDYQSFEKVFTAFLTVIANDRELSVDWKRSIKSAGEKGFLCTNNAISIEIYILARILKKREQQKMPFPESTDIVEWKKYVSNIVLSAFKNFLSKYNDPNKPDDPIGALRGMTSNEAQRSDVAKKIFESINFE